MWPGKKIPVLSPPHPTNHLNILNIKNQIPVFIHQVPDVLGTVLKVVAMTCRAQVLPSGASSLVRFAKYKVNVEVRKEQVPFPH